MILKRADSLRFLFSKAEGLLKKMLFESKQTLNRVASSARFEYASTGESCERAVSTHQTNNRNIPVYDIV